LIAGPLEEQGGYRVSKGLREVVVFARQNLLSDLPFSRMDIISCRNLLIYLEPSLQKKILPLFITPSRREDSCSSEPLSQLARLPTATCR